MSRPAVALFAAVVIAALLSGCGPAAASRPADVPVAAQQIVDEREVAVDVVELI